MEVVVPPLNLGIDRVLLVSEYTLDGIVPDERIRRHVPIPDYVVCGSGDELEPFVGAPYGAFGLPLIGDVDDDSYGGGDIAIGVAHRCRAHSNEPVGPIATSNTNLLAPHRVSGDDRASERPLDRGISVAVIMESDPIVALEIRRGRECGAKNFCHLGVD